MTELTNIQIRPGKFWGTVEVSWDYAETNVKFQRIELKAFQREKLVTSIFLPETVNSAAISGLFPLEPARIELSVKTDRSDVRLQKDIEIVPSIELLGGLIDPVGRS